MVKGSERKANEKRQTLISYAEALAVLSRQFEEKVQELSTIRRIGDALAHSLDLETVCKTILDAVLEGMGGEKGVLILFESLEGVPMAEVFSTANSLKGGRPVYPSDEMIEWAFKEKNPLLLASDFSKESLSFLGGESTGGSAMILPLISREWEIGVISLMHSEENAFRSEQVPAGHLIARQAAISLENVKLLHELIRINEHLEEKILERTRVLQETNQKLVELQSQLIQAEKMKLVGQLTAGISHNLRTPVSVILATADLIKLHSYGNKKVTRYAQNIAQQGGRMAEIIETLMEKSQTTPGHRVEKLNLNHILKKELDFMEGNLDFKHNVVKECHFDPDLPEIEGFYGDFSQTFVNLIDNAVDAMHESEDRRLKICTRHDRYYIYVDVQDTGCGIPDEQIKRIFDFSFTTKAPLNNEKGPSGVGIGLFNSKHLMTSYGAEIKVRSQPGSTAFTVQIPWQG
jgi:signal transduction histidine kinase